jgi:hypothetical protein
MKERGKQPTVLNMEVSIVAYRDPALGTLDLIIETVDDGAPGKKHTEGV